MAFGGFGRNFGGLGRIIAEVQAPTPPQLAIPDRYLGYSDDFETPGPLSSRSNWSIVTAGTSVLEAKNGYLHNATSFGSTSSAKFGPAGGFGPNVSARFGISMIDSTTAGMTTGTADPISTAKMRLWDQDDNNYLELTLNVSTNRLSLSGKQGGASVSFAGTTHATSPLIANGLVGEIYAQIKNGVVRVMLNGQWMSIAPNNFSYPGDEYNVSALFPSGKAGAVGSYGSTYRGPILSYISAKSLDISVDNIDGFVGRDSTTSAHGKAALNGTYTGTPMRWVYRVMAYGTLNTVEQDWQDMLSPVASGGNWSGFVSLPVGGPYYVEAGFIGDDGLLHVAPSRSTMCGILIGGYGQSNSVYRSQKPLGSSYYSHVTPQAANIPWENSSPYYDKWQRLSAGVPMGPTQSHLAAYEIAYLLAVRLGIPVGVYVGGHSSVGIGALVPSGSWWSVDWTPFATPLRGVMELFIWDQGEGDADTNVPAYTATSAYVDHYVGELLPAMRGLSSDSLIANPEMFSFISPVGRYADTTGPSGITGSDATAVDLNRYNLQLRYLDICAADTRTFIADSKLGCPHDGEGYHYPGDSYAEMYRREELTITKRLLENGYWQKLVDCGALPALPTIAHDGLGPLITGATLSGDRTTITLNVDLNGATGLTDIVNVPTGTVPVSPLPSLYGYEVSVDDFATALSINSMVRSGNSLVMTLAAPAPAGTVKVRSMFGWSYDDTNLFYGTYSDTANIPVHPIRLPIVAG